MSKLHGMLRAMDAYASRNAPEPGWMAEDCLFTPQDSAVRALADCDEAAAYTCHRCGAVVDGDALALQMAADGTPRFGEWYCRAHLIAGLERLEAALRAQREGEA